MTSIERAKAFLNDKVKKTALVILPLAAATIHAHAGTITNPTFSYDPISSSFNASGGATPSTTTLNGTPFVTGISLDGGLSGITFTMVSGGVATGDACGNACAGFFASGSGAGVFPNDTLPVTYDFTLQASNGDPLVWTVGACISTTSGEGCNSASGGIDSGGAATPVDGSFNISGLDGQTMTGWSAYLDADFASGWGYSSNDTITITVLPDSSVDLGPVNSVPEPATGWMLVSAGGVFALMRRRFRRR